MSRDRRAVTIMVHKDGDLESWSMRVPLWLTRAAVTSGIVLAVLIVIAAAVWAPLARTAARVPGMNREIARLRAENAQVRDLAATLRTVEQRYEQVRTMLGGDVVPERTRTEGTVPVAHAILARPPGDPGRYAKGPSVPGFWPLDERGVITRGPVGSGSGGEIHSGIDVAVPVGTPIRAAGGGVVTGAGEDPELGLFIRVRHPDGYESMYGHASRLLVSQGDSVQAGHVIALSGSTGRSTAPHLHFEVLRGGRSVDPRSLRKEGS